MKWWVIHQRFNFCFFVSTRKLKKIISFDRKTIKSSDIVELPYTKILVLNVTGKISQSK